MDGQEAEGEKGRRGQEPLLGFPKEGGRLAGLRKASLNNVCRLGQGGAGAVPTCLLHSPGVIRAGEWWLVCEGPTQEVAVVGGVCIGWFAYERALKGEPCTISRIG